MTCRDLVVLVPDKNTELAIRGILSRPHALGIRPVEATVYVHPHNDPGVLLHAVPFLRPFSGQFEYALTVLDLDGCGREEIDSPKLEKGLELSLGRAGWGERCAAVVIEPELETWVWSASPHVCDVLGWGGAATELEALLEEEELAVPGAPKPLRPKEAMELALRRARRPRSSSLYLQLAQRVSLARCADRSFRKLRRVLRRWFPVKE